MSARERLSNKEVVHEIKSTVFECPHTFRWSEWRRALPVCTSRRRVRAAIAHLAVRAMTTRTKRFVIVAAVLAAILAGSIGGICYLSRNFSQGIAHRIAANVVSAHATKSVDTQAWTHLGIGMSREAVIALLGDAPYKQIGRAHV